MLHRVRLGFMALGIAAVAAVFVFSFSTHAEAAARVASVDGNWTNTATWGGQSVPVAGDTVTINTDIVVIVDTVVEAASIAINDPVAADNGITVQTGGSVTLTGALTYTGSSSTGHSTVAVADGALSAGSVSITDGAGTGNMVLSASTGTITVSGDVAFTVTDVADVQITATGASSMNFGGHFPSGGTFTRADSTVTFNGTGAQNIGAYSYTDVVIDKSAGTATLLGETLILNELLISSGTLDSSTHDLDITFLTEISSGATLIHGTGHKVQNGVLVIDEGGTWIETGAATVDFLGHVTNNGTFTANTGLHRFLNFTRDINGTFSIPSVSFIGDAEYTNNGTLTIGTALGGDGELINGASGTLNIGGTSTVTTLTATAVGNTVNYTGATQTVKAVSYDDLNLQGSGTKTIASGINIAGDLSIDEDVKTDLTGASTADRFYLDGVLQFAGVWGSNVSDAQYKNNTYFSGTGTITSTTGASARARSSSGSSSSKKLKTPSKPVVPVEIMTTPIVSVTPAVNYAFGTVLVKLGVKGESCKAWQNFLNTKANAGLIADAHCGPLTMAAAKAWQISQGLIADGLLGPLSREKAMMME
ncbi:MAG: hypothetical protein KBC22_01525 [Candidatus Pacebacteria bacterium]|nr:hypothetical protein [Candidatus Paceibacterota bacterium]